jgi:pyruvate,water dikinase
MTTPTATPTSQLTRELRGAPASRGRVTGTARLLRSPDDVGLLRRGDILVCATARPAWIPLLSIAAGIITETGGSLSTLAISAREYGIPAVVAVDGATTRLQDGQLISIDGASGVISLND